MSSNQEEQLSLVIQREGKTVKFPTDHKLSRWAKNTSVKFTKMYQEVAFEIERIPENVASDLMSFLDRNVKLYEVIGNIYEEKVLGDEEVEIIKSIQTIINENTNIFIPGTEEFEFLWRSINDGEFSAAYKKISEVKMTDTYILINLLRRCQAMGLMSSEERTERDVAPGMQSVYKRIAEQVDQKIEEALRTALLNVTDPEKLIAERETAERLISHAKSKWSNLEATVENKLNDLTVEFGANKANLTDQMSGLIVEVNEAKDDLEREVARLEVKLSRGVQEATKSLEDFDTWAATSREEHQATMRGLEAAYRGELALKAPAQVWEEKAASHKNTARASFFVSILLTFAVGAGAVFGFPSFFRSEFYATSLVPDLFLYGVLLTPIVCGFVLIRFFARIYNLNQALSDDGRQRSALVQAYISLLKEEGVTMSDNEKAIILQALFRAPDFAAAQDSQVSHPIELILNRANNSGKPGGS